MKYSIFVIKFDQLLMFVMNYIVGCFKP